MASDGNFYGTTTGGGVYNDGTVFRLTPSNTVTVLHSFSSFLIGGLEPVTPPTQAADGNLYGITATGTIYRITLSSGTFQLLPNSLTDPGCGYCFATRNPLYLASDGNLYATADYDDTVFRVTTDGDITNSLRPQRFGCLQALGFGNSRARNRHQPLWDHQHRRDVGHRNYL